MPEIRVIKPSCPGLGPPSNIRGPSETPGAGRGIDVTETSGMCPAKQSPSCIRFSTACAGHLVIQLEPSSERRTRRVPGHSRIVSIAYGHQTVRHADPAHLAKGCDRIRKVLHELVGMDNVEGGVAESQLVDVPDKQAEIPHTLGGGHGLGCRDGRRCEIDADHPAPREPSSQIDGNSPGADANVQQPVCGVQLR